MNKKLLIITTNYSGEYCFDEDRCLKKTGVYLEEFAVPFLIFEKSNIDMTIASIEGGVSPVDEGSMSCSNPMEWDKCIKILRNTKKLYDINYKEFDGVYFPGGHGPMFDIAENKKVKEVVEYFFNEGKLLSAICHGVCAFVGAKTQQGTPIVKNKKITSFTNKEEEIVKLTEFVPFLLEDKLKELGANFVSKAPWQEHVEIDRNIITAQNQNSAELLAQKIIGYFSL